MSMINKEVNEFKVKAFVNGEFKDVSKADILGKWSVFFSSDDGFISTHIFFIPSEV